MKPIYRWLIGALFALMVAAIAFRAFLNQVSERHAIIEAMADAIQIENHLKSYAQTHDGKLPASFSDLVSADGKFINSEERITFEIPHNYRLVRPNEALEQLSAESVIFEFVMQRRPKATIQVRNNLPPRVIEP